MPVRLSSLSQTLKTRKALSGYLGPGDPEIKFQAKDLGVDTSGGGLRRIATARGDK